jgi:hypothetical protein
MALYEPVTVAVPEMTPVDVFSDNPVGRAPETTAHEVGVPVAARVWEKDTDL